LTPVERAELRDAPGDDSGSLGSFDMGQMRARLKQQQALNNDPTPVPSAPPTAVAPSVAADCDSPLPPIAGSSGAANKINGRGFPSVFQAWQPATNTGSDHHDLIWNSPGKFGLQCYSADQSGKLVKERYLGLCTAYLGVPPHDGRVVRLAEVRWHDGWFKAEDPSVQYLPADSPLWMNGGPSVPATTTMKNPSYRLNYADACFQKHVALQCQAAVKAGLDGCMFDWWSKPDSHQVEMLRKVRAAIGDALIIVNANGNVPSDLSDVNGVFAEGFGTKFFSAGGTGGNGDAIPYPQPAAWEALIKDLQDWNGARAPRINAIEGWGDEGDSRYMRALTSLVLVYSNSYVLYSRSNHFQGNPDHTHDWDDFWTQDLGRPLAQDPPNPAPMIPGGAVYRRFANGVVVYNPTAAPVAVPAELLNGLTRSRRLRAALPPDGAVSVPPGDGDIIVR
jgi:hypothetical protein